jgi:cob(I)alamin adenosyltransferase
LTEIQSRLLDLGSAIATPLSSGNDSKVARAAFPQASVAQLEAWLDALDARLPALRNFILPGGGLAAASLHAARAVARRAERAVVPLVRAKQADAVVVVYLNRLSDYLFVAARTAVRPGAQGGWLGAHMLRRCSASPTDPPPIQSQAIAAGAPEVIYRKAG